MKDPQLERLAERTRQLLEDMDRARPELLSVSELNRALRQVLANQAALMEALALQPVPSPEPRSETAAAPRIKVTPANGTTQLRELEVDPAVLDAELEETPATEPGGEQAPDDESGETVLGKLETVPGYRAREFIEQFDNRDKDYDKGLEKMNRWIAAGTSGTPFQWRGDRAYLNLNGAGATSARNYEEQLMTRMGFSRRVGRLEVSGLEGEVVVYERPIG